MSNPKYLPGTRVQVKIQGNIVEGVYVGYNERYHSPIVNVGGRELLRKIHGLVEGGAPEGVVVETVPTAPAPVEITAHLVTLDINTRFSFIEKMAEMVINSPINSMVIVGSGGLGKTTTVLNKLADLGLSEDADEEAKKMTIIKGSVTPRGLFQQLYASRNHLVVFDDSDSVFKDDRSLNLLKAAFDDKKTRKIAWLKSGPSTSEDEDGEEVPHSFEFTGKVIFISNLSLSKIPQALLSRSLFVDVTMTSSEKIERMTSLKHVIVPEATEVIKDEVLAFLASIKDSAKELSLRTFAQMIHIRMANPAEWVTMGKYMLTSMPTAS